MPNENYINKLRLYAFTNFLFIVHDHWQKQKDYKVPDIISYFKDRYATINFHKLKNFAVSHFSSENQDVPKLIDEFETHKRKISPDGNQCCILYQALLIDKETSYTVRFPHVEQAKKELDQYANEHAEVMNVYNEKFKKQTELVHLEKNLPPIFKKNSFKIYYTPNFWIFELKVNDKKYIRYIRNDILSGFNTINNSRNQQTQEGIRLGSYVIVSMKENAFNALIKKKATAVTKENGKQLTNNIKAVISKNDNEKKKNKISVYQNSILLDLGKDLNCDLLAADENIQEPPRKTPNTKKISRSSNQQESTVQNYGGIMRMLKKRESDSQDQDERKRKIQRMARDQVENEDANKISIPAINEDLRNSNSQASILSSEEILTPIQDSHRNDDSHHNDDYTKQLEQIVASL